MTMLFHSSASPADARLFDTFFKQNPIAMAMLDRQGVITESNNAFNLLFHEGKNTISSRFADYVVPEKQDEFTAALKGTFAQQQNVKPLGLELIHFQPHFHEQRVTVSCYFSLLPQAEGEPWVLVQVIDTTEQKNLELRFAHSQKMQAVGQLAGGVAHDFNNLLTAMIGFCDLLLMRHPAGDPSFADIMQIKQNAHRAANLVRQLLAFSRKQTLQPKVADITNILAELSHLIRRLIGEHITLKMTHGSDLHTIKVDQGQLEQVIINLAVNARDAMGSGGVLNISTTNITITEKNHPSLTMQSPSPDDSIPEGDYVTIQVKDTGCGIPKELIKQVFEPFFSTKEVGSGTGLGLATVYGIIKQTGGYVYVQSEPGVGSIFQLYFPIAESSANHAKEGQEKAGPDLTGTEHILLVEDETPVRTFAARALSNKGYKVHEADSAEMALEVMEDIGDSIDIIITDVIMPGRTGPDMVMEVRKSYPNVKVIFISGYAEDAFIKTFGNEGDFNFLPKPFTLKQLATKIKEILD